ncbi:hypothetical protein CHH28_14715 [Bacterioplanes sanyensis]|uniref:DUF4269 domain-containing protein n=1 Tax=Bacterioplanes sanyensis TaxID=1249553 RepID=A0A222FM66_9GAMM|nr:DUF4269 domain-containing protein [Bacterioplanes sanyensis]ASP39849.1 hypothetical protein CHH28_14715 [Bacterioplanes sanyensis]
MPSDRITAALRAIDESSILTALQNYQPHVVSTILIGLDTDLSDIDILCCYQRQSQFVKELHQHCSGFDGFRKKASADRIVAEFRYADFLFEIYASNTPTQEQPGYRHFRIMQRLLALGGETFRARVVALKQSGLKTEPAMCAVLSIDGDPYTAILDVEHWTDGQLLQRLRT